MIKIKFFLETPWPRGTKKPYPVITVAVWEREIVMPFVPFLGLLVDCGDGDLRKVQEAYWVADKPERIEVWFEPCDIARSKAFMNRNGWGLQL